METHLIWGLSWGSDSLKGPSEGVSCFPWSAFPGDSVCLPEKTGERRGPPSARPAGLGRPQGLGPWGVGSARAVARLPLLCGGPAGGVPPWAV